ncbi:MarR family transcriptional regulator [Parafrankia soli]|uniref:MarR family transcriptional regulator n=1 Tax=Parafrankia soli TaxID=2599596 RepID=A0A1S1REB9_9ACTN|nr:MarR family transcriptional regulator [Parafrankia soli]
METAPARLRRLPSWLMSQAAAPASRLVTERLAAADARRYHYSLLAALDEFGPASQAALGRRCGLDRSDVVAMVNELVDRELIERTPDPADRRRNIITITPAGIRHLRRLDKLLAQIQDELLAPLSANERDQLVRLLTQLVDHHHPSKGRSREPCGPDL